MGALVLSLRQPELYECRSLYWLTMPLRSGYPQPLENGNALAVELITLAASLAITALILRQRAGGRRGE